MKTTSNNHGYQISIELVGAENISNAARDEQIKPYLTRIDNL